MVELADFLLARIAEDEAAVREVIRDWETEAAGDDNPNTRFVRTHLSRQHFGLYPMDAHGYPALVVGEDRVLAECEAKRRIITRLDLILEGEASVAFHAEQALRALATVYADHDDYRHEW